ncbi:hypothetical protein NUBL22001_46660 [Klebsiella pneumoniae]|nr:hypothetical protein NUBL22001_46660 [Klebsiella pneumoniae]
MVSQVNSHEISVSKNAEILEEVLRENLGSTEINMSIMEGNRSPD